MEPEVAAGFTDSVSRLQDRIDEADLRSALASGSLDAVAAAAQVGTLIGAREAAGLEASLRRTATATGKAGADVLRDVTGFDARFNASDPRVVLAARRQAAGMVVQVQEHTREAIRLVVGTAKAQGVTIPDQARIIREVVGLPPNWVNAPTNLRLEILAGHDGAATRRRLSAVDKAKIRAAIKNGTNTEAFAWEMSETYTKRLISRRAQNIARTESLAASHEGQRQGWKQAIRDQVLPGEVKRFWIVTPDDRLEHEGVPYLNAEGRGIDEQFTTPEGPTLNPPSRPNCRCGVGLLVPGRAGVL